MSLLSATASPVGKTPMSGAGPIPGDIPELQRCLRDLLAVSTLPALGTRADLRTALEECCDVLLRTLSLDVIGIRVPGIETVRAAGSAHEAPDADVLRAALRSWSGPERGDVSFEDSNPFGGPRLRLIGLPVGEDFGVLVAGCTRDEFPTATERLLLSVAANQVATLLQYKHSEESLRSSEHSLADFFENATVGLHWVGRDGTVLRVNRAELELLGYSREEYVGRHIADFHADPDTIADILRRLQAREELLDYPARLRCKDGTIKHVLISSNVRWEDGRFVHTRCFTRDVTAQHQAERRARFLADASAALAEVTDYESTLQRIVALAVPSFADWCTVDILEPSGSLRRLAAAHVNPDKVQLAYELARRYPLRAGDAHGVRRVLRSGEPEWAATLSEAELSALSLDEEHLRLLREQGLRSYICVPLRSRGRILGVLSFVTAESGRAYSADDLQAAQDLAHRAAVAIENASLLNSLREADRRKDEFLAMLAHELRNPLAPIRNCAHLIRVKGRSLPGLERATEIIERQVQHMTRLVDDLLDVSRITRGKIELRKESVLLSTVVDNAIEACRPLIEQWQHELSVSLPREPIRLYGDPARLAQTLSNLLNNAAKYTDRGGRIWLSVVREEDEVVVRVQDTGSGIPPETLPHVFELFTQLDRSLERTQGGLGIGLTLVRQLVELHGGRVEAHSDGPGKGSTFVIRLPVDPVAEQPVAADEARTPAVAAPRRRVLVVDDNQDALESQAELLRTLGSEVYTAGDGVEAVDAVVRHEPEVVLLDIGLPRLNGYEAARRIRALPGGERRQLIALTGWGQAEDRQRSLEAGFDHHLTKPLDLDSLARLLG